ncbi:hypothetical protein SODG_001808 [Sodalis praecaptivus]
MITMQLNGLDALRQQLEALERDVSTKILRQAGRAALAPVQADMRQHAGFDAESHDAHMRDSIKIRSTTARASTGHLTGWPRQKTPHESAGAGMGYREASGAAALSGPALDYQTSQVLRLLAAEIRRGIENR